MATKNVAIKKINGFPLADIEVREMLKSLNITNYFKGKKWAVFGDSISQPNTDGLDKYYNYIADSLEMEVKSFAVGGSGYFKGAGSTGYGENNIIDKLSQAEAGYDIISFMAGINERHLTMGSPADSAASGEPTTLCEAVKKCFETAIEKYPAAQIFLITPTPGTGQFATPEQGDLNTFAENQIAIAKMYNIPFIDLYHESGLRPWNSDNAALYYRDYCHLSQSGQQYIARLIKQFMMNRLVV